MYRALKRARKAGRGLVGCRVSEWQLALANFDGLPRAAKLQVWRARHPRGCKTKAWRCSSQRR
jgi:hypothetical protein